MLYKDHMGNISASYMAGAEAQDNKHILPNFLEQSVSGQTNETFNDG